MANFLVLMPVTNKSFDFKKATKSLKVALQERRDDFEVLFLCSSEVKKPEKHRNAKGFKLVETDVLTENDLINEGFKMAKDEHVMVLGQNYINNLNVISDMYNAYLENNDIVYVTNNFEDNGVKKFFKRVFRRIYNYYLRFFNLGKDRFCLNNVQLFKNRVVKLIKTMPNKNTYLRNFDSLVGYKVKVLGLNNVEKFSLTKTVKKTLHFIIGVTMSILALVSLILVAVFNGEITSLYGSLSYYVLILVIIAGLTFVGSFLMVKDIIKLRANIKKVK